MVPLYAWYRYMHGTVICMVPLYAFTTIGCTAACKELRSLQGTEDGNAELTLSRL